MGSTRYLGQVAAFGNPLNGSDGNNLTRTYNLMVSSTKRVGWGAKK